jgi:hypothetical protein
MGLAIEDIAVARAVYDEALRLGEGEVVKPTPRSDVPAGFIFRPRVASRPKPLVTAH